MSRRPWHDPDSRWAWSISLIALALIVMGVVEFVRPGTGRPVDLGRRGAGAMATDQFDAPAGPIELHQLLPDATSEIGRGVMIAGTIVGAPSDLGFWVRDLRDNIVFVADVALAESGDARPGRAVRIRGSIALFPPIDQDREFRAAGLVVPAGAIVVRGVRIDALAGGVEILTN